MVTQKINSTPTGFSLLASISGSVFSHPAENKLGDNFFFIFLRSLMSHCSRGIKKGVGSHIMGGIIFLMGYKTLCVNCEGLLAPLLILPRSGCTELNVKHVITPSGVSVEISGFLNKPAVFLRPAELLLCHPSSAGWFAAL